MSDVEMANDEGADPTNDIKNQNSGRTTTGEAPDDTDPQKVEKLAKAGEPTVDPNVENPT